MHIIHSGAVIYQPAAHEDLKDPGVLKKVLVTRAPLIKGTVQMINWAKIPPHKSFQSHYHEDMQEVFIIVAGSVEMVIERQSQVLSVGDAVIVDPHEVHSMKNLTDNDVLYICMGITTGKNGKTIVVD